MKKLIVVGGVLWLVGLIVVVRALQKMERETEDWGGWEDGGEAVGPWTTGSLERFYGRTLPEQRQVLEGP